MNLTILVVVIFPFKSQLQASVFELLHSDSILICRVGNPWFWFRVESPAETATETFQQTDPSSCHAHPGTGVDPTGKGEFKPPPPSQRPTQSQSLPK